MDIEYRLVGDYYLPNLTVTKSKNKNILGKYGRMRLNFLKQNRRGTYTILLTKNQLENHLNQIEKDSKNRIENLINQMARRENIDENLKTKDQMKWVGMMNNFKNIAEKIVIKELILK